ncbi:MAG: tetratricopeptide repeat protein [Ignavibacteriales bacterium]|nr:tetratricopeptide repeat protein [Ignavibacteriales bacterium]
MRSKIILIIVLSLFTGLNAQVNQNLDNRFNLAQSFEQTGQLEKAEAIYKELSDAQPWNNIFFEALNKILISQKKYQQSVDLLNNKIKQNPADINLYGLLGTTYFIMGQSDSAFEIWEKGLALNPSTFIGYRIIANYAIENRAYEKAIDILKRGNKISTDPTIFSMDMANIYAANMKYKDAAIEFCNLINHHPDQIQVVKIRMNSYLNGPDAAEQTIEAVNDFTDSKPQLEIFDLLTFVYQTTGNYKNAFENVIKTEKEFSGNGTSIFNFAQSAYRSQQYEWASKSYNYIVQNYTNSPYLPTAKIGYARTLEASLDEKYNQQNESWKPYSKQVPYFVDDYKKIISSYYEFVKTYLDNTINVEAFFRVAEIYRNRIFDLQEADTIYSKVALLSPTTNFYVESNLARGKIAIERNDLKRAQEYLENAARFPRIEPNNFAEANFYLARIEFWKGDFSKSVILFNNASKNLSTDFANDALEFSSLINTTKKDSLNLLLYAKADLLAIQNKYKEAGIEFKTLSDQPNLFILNDFAKIYFVEMLIAQNDLLNAIKVLEEASENQKSAIFVDKSTFLLAQCYQYGTKDLLKAAQVYQKLLETFPNSLYFDRAREALKGLSNKNG